MYTHSAVVAQVPLPKDTSSIELVSFVLVLSPRARPCLPAAMVGAAARAEDPLAQSFHIKEVLGSGTDGRVVRGVGRSAWVEAGRSCALK